jgi:hypothetical protein
MWYPGCQKKSSYSDFLAEFKKLDGTLSDHEAKIWLLDLLRSNVGFTVYLFSGIELLPLQEVILKAMFMRDVGLIVGGRGLSKTLSYNDLQILREKTKGLVSVKSLLPDLDFTQGERWVDIDPINLWNGAQYVEVSKVLIQPRKLTLKITTRFGHQLECAGTHILRSINGQNGQCNLNWTRASELKIGNFLPIGRTPVTGYINKTEAMNLEEREAYLIGLLLGDGCCTSKAITITSMDEEILSFVETFPCGKRVSKKGTPAVYIRLTTEYSKYLRAKYNLGYHKSYTKTIPTNILSNLNLSRFCLRGVFDTDGYSTKRGIIGVGLTSSELINQIKLLLLNFGIVSTFRVKKTPSDFGKAYTIECSGLDAQKFYNAIGFRLKRKQERKQYLKADKFNTNFDIIPFAKECVTEFYNTNCKGDAIRNEAGIRINPDQHHVSYDYVKNFLNWTKSKNITDPKLNNLQEIIDTNYFYDEIVSIEHDFADCIDFNVPTGEQYWCNGFINHNSFLISIFSLFYPIFYPNSKTCIISANFRSSRRILEYSDKVLQDKQKAKLLRRCYTKDLSRQNDLYKFKLPNPCGSEVFALPLGTGGEGLRGTRANAVLVDEGLLITKEIQEFVIRPFLTAKLNFQEQKNIQKEEQYMIDAGLMTEAQRTKFARNKYMVLSSASYQFEYLYESYLNMRDNCLEEKPLTEEDIEAGGKPTYFVMRASYESLPSNDTIMDLTQINAAKALGGENSDYFKREYRAIFTDASSSYFDLKKLHECTVKAGSLPTLQMKGEPNEEYLLVCDPSYSPSKNSDYFVLAVYMLNKAEKTITLVHTYAQAGGELKDHYRYLIYLLRHFNIVWFTIDASGTEFIHGFNESEIAKQNTVNLGLILSEFDTDDVNEYANQLRQARNEYNLTARKIVYAQKFNQQNGAIRRMNENLQNMISAKRVWFGSPISANEAAVEKYQHIDMPFDVKNKKFQDMSSFEWMDEQHTWVSETKAQCAMIELKASSSGTFQYVLPEAVQRNKSESKIRKDNYTCLLMAGWTSKIFFDLMSQEDKPKQKMAMPSVLR